MSSKPFEGSLTKRPLRNIIILGKDHPGILILSSFLVIGIIFLGGWSIWLLSNGETNQASDIASITSALATVLLAALTAVYVVSLKTRNRMIKQHRKDELERKLDSLRKGLLYEIRSLSESRIKNMEYDDTKYVENFAPTSIYERNAEQIGMLTDEEVEAVTEYYQLLSEFEEYLHAYSNREGGGNIEDQGQPLIDSKHTTIETIKSQLKEK